MNVTYTFEIDPKPNRLGLHRIYLRVTANRKLKRLKTEVAVLATQFVKNPQRNKPWIVRHPDAARLNTSLIDFLEQARSGQRELEKTGTLPSVDTLKRHIKQPPGTVTIGQFADEVLSHIQGSYHYKKHVKSRLEVFAKFAGRDTLLSAVNLDLLNRFKRHLALIPVSSSTQHYYFARIKRMMTLAAKLEYVQRDPFLNFEMPPERAGKRLKLSDNQILDVERVEVSPNTWLFRAKWLYLFAYRKAGMRSADVIQLRVGNLIKGERNSWRLEYEMDKTGKLMSLKVSEADWAIIRLFYNPDENPRPAHAYLFGLLDEDAPYAKYFSHAEKARMPEAIDKQLYNKIGSVQTLINRNLKEIAQKAGVEGVMTFHTARHSFADKARRRMKQTKNITVDDIRNSLGHTRLDTTQRYLDSFDREGLDVAMDAVFEEE